MPMNKCGACEWFTVDPQDIRRGVCLVDPPKTTTLATPKGPMTMTTVPDVRYNMGCSRWTARLDPLPADSSVRLVNGGGPGGQT